MIVPKPATAMEPATRAVLFDVVRGPKRRRAQLLFQRFSQSIACCARLNRWLSYCSGAHWSFYFFLKLPGPHISEKPEIFLMCPVQNAGHPNKHVFVWI